MFYPSWNVEICNYFKNQTAPSTKLADNEGMTLHSTDVKKKKDPRHSMQSSVISGHVPEGPSVRKGSQSVNFRVALSGRSIFLALF